jgi:peptide/nickel transport system substrate-binding protein
MTTGETDRSKLASLGSGVSRRRFMMAGAAAVVAPTALQMFLAACTSSSSTGSKSIQSLIIGMDQSDLRTLDPNSAFEQAWFIIGRNVYEPLVTFAGSDLTKVVPSLAKSWTISSDGLVYTFTLDPAAKFWDGSPVTPADIVFNFQRFLNLKGVGSFILTGVQKVAAVGSNQVQITLDSRNPDLLNILTSPGLGIGQAAAIKAHGGTDAADAATSDTARTWLDQHSVGTGPYVVDSWTRGAQLVMKRNANYWKSPGPTQQLIFKFVADASVQRDLLKGGDVHIALNLTPTLAAGLKGTANVAVKVAPSLALAYLALNTVNNPSLRNPSSWDAIRYAIDYDGLKTIYGEGATPIAGCIPFGLGGALPQSEYVKQDLVKAKSALVAAGKPNGFSFKLAYPSDSLLLNFPTAIVAQKIKSDLATVGITADLTPTLAADLQTAYRAGHSEVVLESFTADYAGWTDFEPVFGPTGYIGTNRLGWKADTDANSKQIAQLTSQAESTEDLQQAYSIVQQAQRLMLQSCPYAWLFQPSLQWGYRTDVISDIVFNSVWYFDLPAAKLT